LPSNSADPEAQFEALLSAFRWLRSKLLQDLRDGNKMFVYRHQIQFNQPLAERLAGSIRRHGPGWLLWVRMDDRPDRCFAWVEPSAVRGLLLAGMPHLVTDSPPRVAYDAWEQIAIKAMALRRGDDPPPSPTHGPSTRLALGGTDPERSAVAAVPGSLLAVHTWIWLPSGFSSSSVDISTEGAAVGLGRPVDVSLLGCWQAVWTPVRVAPDRHTISLWLAAPDGVETTVYRTAWTVYRLGPAGTSPART
jgi:hypothetical protein